jgi:hypothetical protein
VGVGTLCLENENNFIIFSSPGLFFLSRSESVFHPPPPHPVLNHKIYFIAQAVLLFCNRSFQLDAIGWFIAQEEQYVDHNPKIYASYSVVEA